MVIVGIDTDANGSVAILDTSQMKLDIYPIPKTKVHKKSGATSTEIDYLAFAAIMLELTSTVHVDRWYLEEQWSRDGQSSQSTFTFGKIQGDIRSAISTALQAQGASPGEVQRRIRYVPGNVWKPALNLSSDKILSHKLADRLFPKCKNAWVLSKYTSAAEAALIAFWGACKEGVDFAGKMPIVNPFDPPILTLTSNSLIQEKHRERKKR
jgi:hypothetical protein